VPHRRPSIIRVPRPPYGFHEWAAFRLQTDARLADARPGPQPDGPAAPLAGASAQRGRSACPPACDSDGRSRPNRVLESRA
jgi:hypothetical protein